ncbi:kelch repeat-containing protein, partial [Planctomycetota bacterium]
MKTPTTFALVGWVTAIVLASAGSAKADTWTRKADMPTPRWAHAIAVVNDKIYAIGGIATETARLNGKALAAVEEYDPATDTWTRKADMPAGMAATKAYGDAAPPVVDGKIYLMGGGTTGSAHVDIYDPVIDTWSRGTNMPTPRNNAATAIWNDKIYVFGGLRSFSQAQSLNRTEVYDPKTDAWTEAAPMPRGVWGHSANVVDDKIYVIGGGSAEKAEQIHQVYDPQTDTWTNAPPLPMAVRNFGASVLRGRIYVVGGWLNGSSVPYSDTWVYDPILDTWTASAPLPEPRIPSMSMVNGRMYAIGGSPRGHNIQATATVYELTLGYDLTGDGVVDAQDMSILVDYWHTDNPRYDVNADGIVDVQDLIALSEHLFEDYRLIAHWKLNESEGDVAYDSAGLNDATLNGGPLWQPYGGIVDGALQFD